MLHPNQETFDFESARILNDLMNVFKISSSDITNKPFIEFICAFGKPIILSTGASNLKEISSALAMARDCLMYWKSDTAHWEKTHSEMPLNETKIDEQKKFIAETSVPLDDE